MKRKETEENERLLVSKENRASRNHLEKIESDLGKQSRSKANFLVRQQSPLFPPFVIDLEDCTPVDVPLNKHNKEK